MSAEGQAPSKTEEKGKQWLLCGLKDSEDRLPDYIEKNEVSDPDAMDAEELEDYENPKVKKIDKRAIEDGYLSGKWEAPILPEKVDQVWGDIKELVNNHKIWGAQVNTKWIVNERDEETYEIRVYTPNFLDENDVMRVGKLLRNKCEIKKEMCYKPDIYNVLQIYSDEGEPRKLPREIRFKL